MKTKTIIFLSLIFLIQGCTQWKRITEGKDRDPVLYLPMLNPTPTSTPTQEMKIPKETFLLMGQSNMVGYTSTPFEDNENVLMYHQWQNWGNLGAGYAFGLARLADTERIILLQTAVCGSSILEWLPGGLYYKRCLSTARDYKDIDGILFYQGETDSQNPEKIPWDCHFKTIINQLRDDLNLPNLPVIMVQIGKEPTGIPTPPNYDWIRERQASVDMANVWMVTSDDLELFGGWHLTKNSHSTLGNRLCEKYRQIKSNLALMFGA